MATVLAAHLITRLGPLTLHAPFYNAVLALRMQSWLTPGAGAPKGAAAPPPPATSFLAMVFALQREGKLFSGIWYDYAGIAWIRPSFRWILAPAAERLRENVGGAVGQALAYGCTDILPHVLAYPLGVLKLRAFFPGNLPRLDRGLDTRATVRLWAGCGASLLAAFMNRFLYYFVWNLHGPTSSPWSKSGLMLTATSLASLVVYPLQTLTSRLALAPDLSYTDAIGADGVWGLFDGVSRYLALGVFASLPRIAVIFIKRAES